MAKQDGARSDMERELADASAALREAAQSMSLHPDWASLARLKTAANDVEQAWSGSSIGYHASVYYLDLATRPPGAHFSSEWGRIPSFVGGTTGEWREYRDEDILERIYEAAGNPSLISLSEAATELNTKVEDAKATFDSILSLAGLDAYLQSVADKAQTVRALRYETAIKAQLPQGSFSSRDSLAVSQGLRVAPHQHVYAQITVILAAVKAAEELAKLIDQARAHLARRAVSGPRPTLGNRVFIGHGRSPVWRELKDFVQDRLHLPWDEFERTPTAGIARTERMQEMLESAGMAFLVLTAEDERADGALQARQNVIHEVGLFQARLGVRRAVIMLEEGCEEFSNVHGLGQIRFPRGNIGAVFEKVRAVLEREGLIAGSAGTATPTKAPEKLRVRRGR